MVSRGPPLEGGVLALILRIQAWFSFLGLFLNPKGCFSGSGNEQEPQGKRAPMLVAKLRGVPRGHKFACAGIESR